MPEIEKIKEEITRLEQGPTTYTNCEKLAYLYTVLDHMDGQKTAKPHDYANEKTATSKIHEARPVEELSADMVMELAAKMENEDGSHGPHWTMEQIKNVMAQKGITADPADFYLAMNMMYSDYYNVAKRMNMNNTEFYASMAKAFLDDKDGGKDKLMKYFRYVVG